LVVAQADRRRGPVAALNFVPVAHSAADWAGSPATIAGLPALQEAQFSPQLAGER